MTMCVYGIGAMGSDVVESDEDILTSEIADDALERAAVVTEVQVTTIVVSITSSARACVAAGT